MSLHEILNKSVKASVKIQRVSPRKARLVADLIRYRSVTEALLILQTTHKKSSEIILKLLNSAIANATNNAGLDAKKLYVSKILVNDGPTLKRFQPHSRGRAFPLLKRTSNFYIELAEIGSESFEEELETKLAKSSSEKEPKKEEKVSKETKAKVVPVAKKASEPKVAKEKVEVKKSSAQAKPAAKKPASEKKVEAKPKASAPKKPTAKKVESKEKGGK